MEFFFKLKKERSNSKPLIRLSNGKIFKRFLHRGPDLHCSGCHVKIGELHFFGCPNEVCPSCNKFLKSCGCLDKKHPFKGLDSVENLYKELNISKEMYRKSKFNWLRSSNGDSLDSEFKWKKMKELEYDIELKESIFNLKFKMLKENITRVSYLIRKGIRSDYQTRNPNRNWNGKVDDWRLTIRSTKFTRRG